MKRIVFMCDTYLPKASPNGICVQEVAQNLKTNNYDVNIITTVNVKNQKVTDTIDGISVYRVNPGFVVNSLLDTEGSRDLFHRIKRKCTFLVSRINGAIHARSYPLTAPVQVKNYYACLEKLNEDREVDFLVCCYHKIAAVVAGIKFKKNHPNVKFVVYTLDAISGGLVFPVLHSMKISMNSLKRWEKRIFQTADKVFAMESHRQHYQSDEYNGYREKIEFLDIPLIKSERIYQEHHNGKTLHFVYTGSMSHATANPKYFISLLRKLKNVTYIFDIYGTISKDIEELLNQYDSQISVVCHGKVPYEDIPEIQKEADILLNFGNVNPCMIPCKIFEYISTGGKILSFTKAKTDSSLPYIERYPNACIIDETKPVEENMIVFKEFLETKQKIISESYLKELYEKNTPDYFRQQIENL